MTARSPLGVPRHVRAVADDLDPVDALEIPGVQPPDHVRQHRVHEVVRRARQHAVGLERALARPEESLDPFASHPVVVQVAQEPDAIERAEHVSLVDGGALAAVAPEELLDLVAAEDVPGDAPEEALQVQVADVRGDLGQSTRGRSRSPPTFTASFTRCSWRRSSGRSAARRSPMVMRSRGRSSVWRHT